MSQSLDWDPKCSSKPKVGQLDLSFLGHKNVLRLKVSVHDSMSVAVINTFDDLVDETFNKVGGELLFNFSEVLFKIVLDVLKDEVQRVVCIDNFFKPEKS